MWRNGCCFHHPMVRRCLTLTLIPPTTTATNGPLQLRPQHTPLEVNATQKKLPHTGPTSSHAAFTRHRLHCAGDGAPCSLSRHSSPRTIRLCPLILLKTFSSSKRCQVDRGHASLAGPTPPLATTLWIRDTRVPFEKRQELETSHNFKVTDPSRQRTSTSAYIPRHRPQR